MNCASGSVVALLAVLVVAVVSEAAGSMTKPAGTDLKRGKMQGAQGNAPCDGGACRERKDSARSRKAWRSATAKLSA